MVKKSQCAPFFFIKSINTAHEMQNFILLMLELRNGSTNGSNLAQRMVL
jgi:hypothetical protein